MVSSNTDAPKVLPQNSGEDVAPNNKVRRESFQKSAEVGFGRSDDSLSSTTKKKAWKPGMSPRNSRGKVWPPPSVDVARESFERGEENGSALNNSIGQLSLNEPQEGASPHSVRNRAKTWGPKVKLPDDVDLFLTSPGSAPDDGKKKVWKPPPKVDEQRLPSHFRTPKPRQQTIASAKWNLHASDSALEIPEHPVTPSVIKKQSAQWPPNRDDIISPLSAVSPRVLPARSPIGSKLLPVTIQWPPIGGMDLHPGEKSKERTQGIAPEVPVKTRKTEFELQHRGITEGTYTESPERRPLRARRKEHQSEYPKEVEGPYFSEEEDDDLDGSSTFDDDDDEDSQGRAFYNDSPQSDRYSLDSTDDDISSDGSFAPTGRHGMVDKRTGYRIRYDGPTNLPLDQVYSLPPVPDLDDRFLSSSIPKDGAPSRPNRFVDTAPSRPSRPASFDADEPYSENTRPDVWITPLGGTADADQMWKVKRVWAEANADEAEHEHNVNNEDLYRKIRNLVGAPHSPEGARDDLPKMPLRNWHVKKFIETDGKVDKSLPEESVHDDEIEQRVEVIAEEARIEQAEHEKACEEYKKTKEEYKKEKAATAVEGTEDARPWEKPRPYYKDIREWSVEGGEEEKKESQREAATAATEETVEEEVPAWEAKEKPKRYYRIKREWSVESGDINASAEEDEEGDDDSSKEPSTEWSVEGEEEEKKESQREAATAATEETVEEEVPAWEAKEKPKRYYRIKREWSVESGDTNASAEEDEEGDDDSSKEPSTRACENTAGPPAPTSPTKIPKCPTKKEGFKSSAPDIPLWWQRDDAKQN
jgi:hypothetical protein